MLNQISWVINTRTILEFLYFIATIGMCIAAFKALKQIKLTKEINCKNNKRESIRIALEQCTVFSKEIIPEVNKLFQKLENDKCTFFTKVKIIKTPTKIDFKVSAKDEEIDQAFEYTNDIIHILNSFDTVAIYFINKIADVEIAFSIMASPYVEFFDTFYPIISSLDDFQKNASYKLYIMWSNKLENMKNHEQIKKHIKKIKDLTKNQMPISTIIPIGTEEDI